MQIADLFLSSCLTSMLHEAPWPTWPGRSGSTSLGQAATQLPDDDALAAKVLERIEFHGIASFLSNCPEGLAGWPSDVSSQIRQTGRWRAVRDALARKCVGQLVDRLADAGVPSLVLKGDAIAYGYYANPALRPRSDSDLLITPENLETARGVLRQLGWVQAPAAIIFPSQEDWLFRPGNIAPHALDLHWRLTSRPTLNRALPVEFLWSQCQPLPSFSRHAQGPSPFGLLLHGALNQALHEHRGYHGMGEEKMIAGRRLIWSYDYWLICRNFTSNDWQALTDFAVQQDMGAIVHAALTGAIDDIGLFVPAEVMAKLLPANGHSPTLAFIKQPQISSELQADWKAAETLRSWLALLVNHGLQTRAALLKKYPGSERWPTFALQVRRYCDVIFRRRRATDRNSPSHRQPLS